MDGLTVAVRFLLYLDLMVLFGLPAFSIYALRGAERISGTLLPLCSIVAVASLGGVLLSVLGLASLAAGLAGTALFAFDREMLEVLLFETSSGTAWQLRIGAFVVVLVATWPLRHEKSAAAGATVAALAGGAALATLAWGGHGIAGEGALGWLQLAADLLHLLAAGAWVGAMVAMLLLVLRPAKAMDRLHLLVAHRALVDFSKVGTIVVAALIATGVVNLLAIVGWSDIAALYGQLLLVKLMLFGGMLVLAASNRFHLVPRFERAIASDDHRAALAALRRSLAAETLCATIILALVSLLGTLDPSAAA